MVNSLPVIEFVVLVDLSLVVELSETFKTEVWFVTIGTLSTAISPPLAVVLVWLFWSRLKNWEYSLRDYYTISNCQLYRSVTSRIFQ